MSTVAPLQNAAAKQSLSNSLHTSLLQRKCDCGSPTSALTGQCEECKGKKKRLQKLSIGASNDPLEQEADRVADQVLAIPANSAVSTVAPRIQRFTGLASGQTDTAPASVDRVLAGSGRPLEPALQQDMGQRFGYDFSQVRVHSGSAAEQSARDVNAHAYTVGHDIVFGAGRFAPGTHEGRRLIAHELTHVMQQLEGNERKANRMVDSVTSHAQTEAPAMPVQSGHKVWLQRQVDSQLSSPYDHMVVERARLRLRLLQSYLSEWEVRESRRQRTVRERTPLMESRSRMDQEGTDLGEAMNPGGRTREEVINIARLNRRPLDIQITDQEIRVNIRFHLRFEDPQLANRFGDLCIGLRSGIDMVWNQNMRGEVFLGRRLVLKPQFAQIASTATRDQNFWLITVRPSNQGPAVYPGCSLPPVPASPTSVTDPNCDGGVMSIPPAHIMLGHVLGHEMLHLFGLVDRYALIEEISANGQRQHRNDPTRATGGRRDPLGAEQARILPEDLGFLFDRLGVYEIEENHGLDTLQSLERKGLTIGAVRIEIHRLEEIIRLGRDPRSLLPIRRNFTDRMVRQAEEIQ